ncbi:MAG TPA: DUF485 domain-containing protein [Streptosporangiaceae bacterium]|nr:DUF485 domain-containing protein [Streptosporangiaceae bacterium]
MDNGTYQSISESAPYQELRRRFRTFVFPMTAAFLLWYLLYVVLSAYARGFMGTKVVGNINVALVFGLLQFVSTFAITWWYAKYAARRLDPAAEDVRNAHAEARS